MRNSISEIPYEEFSRDSFRFKVTNQEGLFPLLIEARDSIQKILPESVAINFRKNVEQMAIYYRSFIES
ncbi:hypothetical protein LEP1GSC067_2772 [Leptospira interrogans serovar Lora str. TE 1992]|uniref:Uncharacterized protein n=1 Tax=Leptospira interrogans serovar Lora str. TE 1992 TaxID=1193028 RepID=M3ECN7_LEPIR|nr:hypothetical protein LEP1GSC067_2772 [Leptospira interrogans serovar Lora str. TE 1992]